MLDSYLNNTVKSIIYSHSRETYPNPDFHLHNQFEVYFFINGNAQYFVEKKVFHLNYGDLLVMNNHEIHKPSFLPGEMYERIVIHFDPSLLRLFNTPEFDLLQCFLNRPRGEQNRINLTDSQKETVFKSLQRLENIINNPVCGWEILKLTSLIELLVYINQVFLSISPHDEHPNIPENLIPILDYIDHNLPSDLSLEFLEEQFFINRFHLSRLFKKITGSNLHDYIICKRISLAKKILADGYNVTDACQMSGFNDYSNFIRTFKRTVGISPGHFQKTNHY